MLVPNPSVVILNISIPEFHSSFPVFDAFTVSNIDQLLVIRKIHKIKLNLKLHL